MGSNVSKYIKDGSPKSTTVKPVEIIHDQEILDQTFMDVNNDAEIDPRSPHICRTPLNEVIKSRNAVTKSLNLTEFGDSAAIDSPTCGMVSQKLLKNFNYNLFDPRSPSQFIDRTPLVFDESTDLPVYVDLDSEAHGDKTTDSLIGVFEKPFTNDDFSVDTPKSDPEMKKRDPRSPTEGVERTPIVFTDDVSDQEILQSVILKLGQTEIQNKQLERVKNPRGRAAQRSRPTKEIYEDKSPKIVAKSTPKKVDDITPKRTPLSCVANKSHFRSKSLENSAKSLTNKIAIYDDYKLKNCQNNCDSGESRQTIYGRRLNI